MFSKRNAFENALRKLDVACVEVKHQTTELDIESPWHNPPALRRFREMGQARRIVRAQFGLWTVET